MKLVSFDPLRTLKLPVTGIVKPEAYLEQQELIQSADWLLFPEYWQLNTLAYAWRARLFPSLPSYTIGHNKIEMTRVFQALCPANVPHTVIGANTASKVDELWEQMLCPFVAKVPKSSRGEGVFLIEERRDWQRYCELTDVLYAQQLLPIDRDLRLIVIGDEVIGGYWRMQSHNGFHNNIARGGQLVSGLLPESAVALVESLARQTGIDHAGFDIAMVGGHPYVLEFNRIFGTQGVERLLGDLSAPILRYLQKRFDDNDPDAPQTAGRRKSTRRGAKKVVA